MYINVITFICTSWIFSFSTCGWIWNLWSPCQVLLSTLKLQAVHFAVSFTKRLKACVKANGEIPNASCDDLGLPANLLLQYDAPVLTSTDWQHSCIVLCYKCLKSYYFCWCFLKELTDKITQFVTRCRSNSILYPCCKFNSNIPNDCQDFANLLLGYFYFDFGDPVQ